MCTLLSFPAAGYGAIYTTNMLVLESYAQGTPWTIPDSQFELFAHLVLDEDLAEFGPHLGLG